jgi:hypothetical protein
MLKHYSHIRMEAKRKALEAIVTKPNPQKSEDANSASGEPAVRTTGTARTPGTMVN